MKEFNNKLINEKKQIEDICKFMNRMDKKYDDMDGFEVTFFILLGQKIIAEQGDIIFKKVISYIKDFNKFKQEEES